MTEWALTLPFPDELLDVVVQRVVDRVAEHAAGSPWMTRAQAAEYLSVPVSRLEKDRTVPFHRWEGRVLYNRHELDAYMLSLGQDG
jgi:hypothetical protein